MNLNKVKQLAGLTEAKDEISTVANFHNMMDDISGMIRKNEDITVQIHRINNSVFKYTITKSETK